jgi:hypothetical protein
MRFDMGTRFGVGGIAVGVGGTGVDVDGIAVGVGGTGVGVDGIAVGVGGAGVGVGAAHATSAMTQSASAPA